MCSKLTDTPSPISPILPPGRKSRFPGICDRRSQGERTPVFAQCTVRIVTSGGDRAHEPSHSPVEQVGHASIMTGGTGPIHATRSSCPLRGEDRLSRPRHAWMLAFGLMLIAPATAAAAAAEPPRIGRPRPAPATPPDVPPLPPAAIDNTLSIGGQDVKARAVDTRLSVDVLVNGRGPYRFVVDSGADTSAVGLRIAHDLQLPLGEPAIVNGMTSRDLVDRVKVGELTLGPSTVRNLELPALRELDLGGDGLVGIDALVQQRLMMDFERHLIKVEDASVPVKIMPGDIVITAKRRRGQLILTAV